MAFRKKRRQRTLSDPTERNEQAPSQPSEREGRESERKEEEGARNGGSSVVGSNARRQAEPCSPKYNQPLSVMATQMELSVGVDYTAPLPKKRRKMQCCFGLSFFSWLFLLLALLQAVLVIGFQVAIAVLGKFRGGQLQDYVECFEESIGFNGSETFPQNLSFPSFGRDKEIYVYFFIALVLYSFCLCVYALKFQNIIEIYMFLVINLLAMAYGGVQVYQFRGFGEQCAAITTVGFLALANALMLLVFTVIFLILSFFIYLEFGWKIYTRVGFSSELRYYYRVYELFMSGVKILILFLLIFFVGQCVLLLFVDKHNINYEFWIVVFILIPLCFASYPLVYWIVRHENTIGSIVILITDIAIIIYTIYKTFTYATRSCPLCKEQVAELREEVSVLERALGVNGSDDVREIINRVEHFEHLVLFAVVNLAIAILVLCIFIHLWRQYGKGLKDHFASSPTSTLLSCCKTKASYNITTEPKNKTFLRLKKGKKMAKHVSRDTSTRDSELAASSPMPVPDFSTGMRLNVQLEENIDRDGVVDDSREFPSPAAPDNTRTRFTS